MRASAFGLRNTRYGFLAVTVALVAGAHAAKAATSFENRAITIYVGSGAGGIYDMVARLVARHIGRHIPGSPTMIVQNMPGAGSIVAANHVYNVAPKDGTALGIMSPSVKVMEAFPGAKFKAEGFNWIGRVVSTVNVTITYNVPGIATISDAKEKEVSIAATAPSSPLSFFTRALNVAGGTKFKVTHGYTDANAVLLAVERGEVEGATVSWNSLKSMRPQWIKDDRLRILVQYSTTKHSQMGHVPLAPELALGKENRELMDLLMNAAVVGMAIMAPPSVESTKIQTLRDAFSAMIVDPDYKTDASRIDPDLDPLSGGELQAAVDTTAHLPEGIMLRASKIVTGKE